jgi:hypothetical protein
VHPRKHSLEIVSIDEGIQIDRTDEQFLNVDSPRIETVQPLSKVNFERFVHFPTQESEIVSVDERIQIDRSDEQFENANLPRIKTLQQHSNVKLERISHQRKHPHSIFSIVLQIPTFPDVPTYRTIEIPSQQQMKSSISRKNSSFGSIQILIGPDVPSAEPFTWSTIAGIQIDVKNANGNSPRIETLELFLNVKLERLSS